LLLAAWLANAAVHADAARNGACPEARLAGYTAQPYASEKGTHRRCALLSLLPSHGRLLPPVLQERLHKELAKQFTAEIRFKGSVELDGDTVEYLMRHMPETAALVTAYSDTDYRATQTDAQPGPAGFFVTNNDTFAANFAYLRSRATPHDSEHVFLENGYAKVLLWRVWGNAIIHYTLANKAPGVSDYDITVHVFTDSRLLHSILKSRLFGFFADKMFQGILLDVETGVRRFADDPDPEEILAPYFINDLQATLPRNDPATKDLPRRFADHPSHLDPSKAPVDR